MTFEPAVQHMIAAIKARMGIAVTYAGVSEQGSEVHHLAGFVGA